jgi:hypothetical protein
MRPALDRREPLNPMTVSKDVWPQNIAPVGRYALHVDWSDGHRSGIYNFERLRKAAGFPEGVPRATSRPAAWRPSG